ncbi:Periplasmic AppA protein precursor [Budvicia aquatica]|uniref:Periplasmic AppA protein n=1 Tax=Budvicia aquatica TaxID=82979 RepID=A0A484ZR94_9GAMM|nr:Periplasmic AppA protein precursor [Budvicia aquatica]
MEIIDRLSKLSALMLLGCSCLPALAVSTPVNGYVLERVVILSRHGVRSPTKQTDLMNNVTPDKWPQWPVQAGYLTPQGEHLMTLMGGFYRDYFRSHNLLPSQGCPTDGSLYVWADIDQRTRLTGQAFLAGVAPECDLKIPPSG